jgi:hypothetical protein
VLISTFLVLFDVPLGVLSGLPGMANQGLHYVQVCDVMFLCIVELVLGRVAGKTRALSCKVTMNDH